MKIYYLLGNNAKITPISGDRISELNIIKALSKVADIYYNNTLYKGGNIAGAGNKILKPRQDCDLYYIRANTSVLNMIPKNKLVYFASPFNKIAFEKAVCITTYSDSWTKKMKENYDFPYSMYPNSFPGKTIKTINQVIDPIFYKNKDEKIVSSIRKEVGGSFILGHFGRVSDSCFPHVLLRAMPKLITECPGIKFLFATSDKYKKVLIGSKKYRSQAKNIIFKKFDYKNVPDAISACDATIYTYIDRQGHFAGSMKVLESMARGVPIILPKYDARVDELGSDYPFFFKNVEILDPKSGEKLRNPPDYVINDFIKKVKMAYNKKFAKKIGEKIKRRSMDYNIKNSAKKLKKTFLDIKSKANDMKKFNANIIINTYKGDQKLLVEAVNSCLKQNDCNIKLIVSTVAGDPSIETLKGFDLELVVSRVPSIYGQLNAATKKITEEWWCYMSGNDLAYPDKMRLEISKCIKNNAKICYSAYDISNGGKKVRTQQFPEYSFEKNLEGNFITDVATMHKDVLDKYGPFSEDFDNLGYWDFWLRVGKDHPEYFIYNSIPTFLYKVSNESRHIIRSKDKEWKKRELEDRRVMLKRFGPLRGKYKIK